MNTKKLLVSFLAVAIVMFAIVSVSAGEITEKYEVEVDGVLVLKSTDIHLDPVSVVAGDTITVDVYFTALVDDTDVTIDLTLEGDKVDTQASSVIFDVEAGKVYHKKIKIDVPFELKDQRSDNIYLNVEIDGKDSKTELPEVTLNVQRPSYNTVIKSLTMPNSISAGETFPVDFVLKNMGYNNLDDLYVEVSIPELGISQGPKWVGDLVYSCDAVDCGDNDEDTVAGRLYLDVPYGVVEGVYELEFTVYNDDVETTMVKQIVLNNDFSQEVIVMSTEATVSAGENAVFSLLLVNPTNNVKVYKILAEDVNGLSISTEPQIVAVPAGSSKTVSVTAYAEEQGNYDFSVNVLSGESLVDSIDFNVMVEGKTTNTTVILTIILAIIFLVLLVILIVLIGRKPEKTEDFGESYY
ncbi:MAG: hypothetical protein KC516_01205 [Nanoarchaeota archaeon]|nr:hypothetical protein [Nanoarchaeota archaeon]